MRMAGPGSHPERPRNKTELVDEISMAVDRLRRQPAVRANNMVQLLAASQVIVQAERLRALFEQHIGHPVAWTELAQIYQETYGIVDRQARAEIKEILSRVPDRPEPATPTEAPAASPRTPTSGQGNLGTRALDLGGLDL